LEKERETIENCGYDSTVSFCDLGIWISIKKKTRKRKLKKKGKKTEIKTKKKRGGRV